MRKYCHTHPAEPHSATLTLVTGGLIVPLYSTRSAFARVFTQRCFYLFLALVLLIVLVPLIGDTPRGRITANVINLLVLLAAVAAVGRSMLSFVIALLLAVPTLSLQLLGIAWSHERYLALSWMFGGAFYFATIIYLQVYVFTRESMTSDKLYGAAASYLMVGVLWAYLYLITQHFYPGAFSASGTVMSQVPAPDLIYFSFSTLTTTGFGDIAPVHRVARTLATLEAVLGTLYVATLIARLAGLYPEKAGS